MRETIKEERPYHSTTLDTWMAQVGRESALAGSSRTARAAAGARNADVARATPTRPTTRDVKARLRAFSGFEEERDPQRCGGGEEEKRMGRRGGRRPAEIEEYALAAAIGGVVGRN